MQRKQHTFTDFYDKNTLRDYYGSQVPMVTWDHEREASGDPDIACIMHMWILLRCGDHSHLYGARKHFHQIFHFNMNIALDPNCIKQELLLYATGVVRQNVFERRLKAYEGEEYEYNIIGHIPKKGMRSVFVWRRAEARKHACMDVVVKALTQTTATAIIKVYSTTAVGYEFSCKKLRQPTLPSTTASAAPQKVVEEEVDLNDWYQEEAAAGLPSSIL